MSNKPNPTQQQLHSDLPDRNSVRIALYKSEERFRQIVEHTNEWVWEVDIEGVYTYSSHVVERILGYTPEEIVGKKHFYDLMIPEDREALKENAFEVFAQRGSFNNLINRNLHKNGDVKWLSTSGVPMFDENDEFIGYRGVDSDITEQKMYEDQLKEAKNAAERANHSKSLFLANMSHEIRTPMNSILGFADALADENLKDSQIEYVNIIRNNCKQLMQMINDILDVSKIEVGQLDLDIGECSITQLLETLDSSTRAKTTQKSIGFKILREPNLPEIIRTDRLRLIQCLDNLISNAITFTEKGHIHINISLEFIDESPFIRFDVIDTGIGIPQDKLKTIFDKFSQALNGTVTNFGCIGLGLTITRSLVELMGGTISVISTPGQGSTFTISVPANVDIDTLVANQNTEEISITSDDKSSYPQPVQTSADVLVAEDNPTNQKLIELLLKNIGLNVTIVENGKKAIDAVAKQTFDMIFMDMQMPIMNGYDATKILRKNKVEIPIIAVTAHAMKGDREKCINAGCSEYISKPINRETLFGIIARFLDDS